VRVEAPTGQIDFRGNCSPTPILSPINPTIVLPVTPTTPNLRIVSVGGYLVPDPAGARTDTADLVLPTQLPDPIQVVVEATNVPVGTPVTLSYGTSNQGTATAATLQGGLAHSTATIGVSGLNRSVVAYLYVQVVFTLENSGGAGASGPQSGTAARVRMTTALGSETQVAFLAQDGSEIPSEKLPQDLRAWKGRRDPR